MKFARLPYLPGLLLFIISIVVGVSSYQDYGVAWDEAAQRDIGMVNYQYVFEGDRAGLDSFINKDYGPAFEILLIGVEKALKLESFRDIYLMRHLACHMFFLIGCLCAYILAFRMFKSRLLGCLAFLMIYLSPRFYAHSFFNSKDIVFLVMFIISFLAIQFAYEKRKTGWMIVAGLCCGYTTGIRILGIILPAAMALVFLLELITSRQPGKRAITSPVKRFSIFIGSYLVATFIFWPFLWTDPFTNFFESYTRMAHFRWDGWILMNRGYVHSLDLPAGYFPMWFGVTVPVLWLLLGVTGLIWLLIKVLKRPLDYITDPIRRNYLIYLLCFFLPIMLVIVLKSVIYDDWRHLYFVFAAFTMFVLFAVYQLMQTRLKMLVIGLCALQLGLLSFFMIKNHPFQQVYFNEFMTREPEFIRHNWEMDYWGVSTKQGLEYVLANDTSSSIRISNPNGHVPLYLNIDFLPADQRRRIVRVDETDSFAYFITFFRSHPEDYEGHVPLHDIKVMNNTILRISTLEEK